MKTHISPRRQPLPGLPPRHLSRRRLLDGLARGLGSGIRFSQVVAGPGTGKTTLLSEYVRAALSRGGAQGAIWLALSPFCRDPVSLVEGLLAEIQIPFPGLGHQAAEVLRTLGPEGLRLAAGLLCDGLAGVEEPLVLALDGGECWPAGQEPVALLQTLIDLFPDQHQLVIAGRSLPGLKLAQHKLRGAVVTLVDEDLAFSRLELAMLVDHPDPTVRAATVDRVFDRTLGWATGVFYAVAEGASGAGRRLEQPELLFEYLSQELFATLPDDFRQGLLTCAYLPRIAAGSCRELLGTATERFLRQLSTHPTLATRIVDQFELHPLFRDFLQREILSHWTSEDRRELFGRLARNATSEPEEAISYLQLASDWETAEAQVVQTSVRLFRTGRLATLWGLLAGFPDSWRCRSAWLSFLEGEVARRRGEFNLASVKLGEADRLAKDGSDPVCQGWIAASLAANHGARGDVDRQMTHAIRALELLPVDASWHLAFLRNTMGMYHLYRHELATAKEQFRLALGLFVDAQDHGGRVLVLHNLGLAHASGGRFDEAIQWYSESISRAKSAGILPLPLTYNNLALARHYLGEAADAWGDLERGMAIAERTSARRDRTYLLRSLGILHLHCGDELKAQEFFEMSLAEAIEQGDRLCETSARIRLAETTARRGDAAGAQAVLDRAIELGGGTLRDPGRSDAAMLQVEIALELGRLDLADDLLKHLSGLSDGQDPHLEFLLEGLRLRRAQMGADSPAMAIAQERLADFARRFGFERLRGVGPSCEEIGQDPVDPSRPTLEVRVLGKFEVRVEGRVVSLREFKTTNSRLALIYLLMHPEGVTKEGLIEAFFPNEDPSRTAIHVIINRLRQALEPRAVKGTASRFVFFQEGRYVFNCAIQVSFDVADFRRIVHQARQSGSSKRGQLLDQAIRLYCGVFLVEVVDQPWCLIERERLRCLATMAFEERMALAAAVDDWVQVETLAESLLALDPGEDSGIRAKVAAFVMQDRLADAQRFSKLVRRRQEEGGASPSDDTVDFLAGLDSGDLKVRTVRECLVSRW